MADRKVTFRQLQVHKDGEPIGKGELYYTLYVGDHKVVERTRTNPVKIGSGGVLNINESEIVRSLGASEDLVISGTVSEKDPGSAEESDSFRHSYSQGDSWGLGAHEARLMDGRKFDVTLEYDITEA